MTNRTTRLFTILVLAMLGAATGWAATPPGIVSYQGVLRSAAGAPLDGTFDMVFRFTDAPLGGTLLLTDLHTGPDGVVVGGGLFTALLGSGTLAPGTEPTLEAVFANHAPVYVEVQVGAETLSPRVQVVSTGFALNAGRLGGQAAGAYVDTAAGVQMKQGPLGSHSGLLGHAAGANTGVEGTTASGAGVRGTSTATTGTTYGVRGTAASTDGTGVLGEATATDGDAWGVHGKTASAGGIGVLGSALADGGLSEGVRGQSTSPTGKGVVGGAFAGAGVNYGVYGESQSVDGTGVYGRASAASGVTTGVGGETFSPLGTAILGVAHATSGDAWGVYGATTSPTGYGVVSDGDSVTVGDVYATGTKFFMAEHPHEADRAIRFACLEGGEVAVYQRGRGRLEQGEARIPLPEPFRLVAAGRITVHVTPLEESGGLFVPDEDLGPEGFTVREQGGATSDATFSYLAIAERAGYEGADPIRPISLADKVLTSGRLAPDEKIALRAALSRTPVETLSAAARAGLYAALHDGDFDATCRQLDDCVAPVARPGTVDRSAAAAAPPLASAPSGDATRPAASPPAGRPGTPRAAADPTLGNVARIPRLERGSLFAPFAELHEVSEQVEEGDVLVLDPDSRFGLRAGDTAFDPSVVGVVAAADGPPPDGALAPVAVAGTVRCKVDAEYGSIAAGDLLVVSPTRGHAMRAQAPPAGTVVGKALESLDWGRGTIRILVVLR